MKKILIKTSAKPIGGRNYRVKTTVSNGTSTVTRTKTVRVK